MSRTKGAKNKSNNDVKKIIDKVYRRNNSDSSEIFSKLREVGNGIMVQDLKSDGVVVYQKPPDAYALRTLAEFRHGKPSQQVSIDPNANKVTMELIVGRDRAKKSAK